MQSHTGHTCLTFLHCALSNVSSNWLPLKMKSHIDCMSSTFPQVWKHCDLIFYHCAFLNILSNCVPLWRQSHIALWVKQCNYKDCKVFKSKTLVRLHFSSEIIQTFFKWCQTAKSLWLILGLIIYTKYLRSYLQKKHEGGVWQVWKFVCWPISSCREKK